MEALEPRLLLSRHQIFKSLADATAAGGDFTQEIGFRYYYGSSRTTNAAATDGRVVYLRDSIQWAATDTAQLNPEANPARQGAVGFHHAYDNEMRFLFRGSGVALLYVGHPAGEVLNWEIVDGGQQGAFHAVFSGTLDTHAASQSLQTQQLVAPGTLDTNKLYLLRVWVLDSDVSAARNSVYLDAIDVADEQQFLTDDNASSAGSWSYSATWTPATNETDPLAIGGGRAAENVNGATITYTFQGTSVAVFGFSEAGINGAYDWNIDGGGSGLQGTVDQSLDSDFALRWAEILVNGLAAGSHVLTITVRNPGNLGVAGQLGPKPNQGYTQIDAIAVIGVPIQPTFWADVRGLYVFNNYDAVGPWSTKDWTLSQWETWLDTMQFMHLNHVQLLRAPWSERPAQTAYELAKEDLWVQVLQAAKARGMKTSLVFGTTWHGDLNYPWRILSPGNTTSDPNYVQLVSDYQYFANRFGLWVDEWYMGVEDPGGSPSSAGLPYAYETPSPLGNPSTVAQFASLLLAMRSAAQQVNPSSTVHAAVTGLQWWGKAPGYATQFDQFLALAPALPADIPLSHWGFDAGPIDQLQALGRDVNAWPFYLFDHEFPVGATKLHFAVLQQNLEAIRLQGINEVVPHISHPIEQLPVLYVYSRLLENTGLSELALLKEFAGYLVSDVGDQTALANAIHYLGLYWTTVSGVANWDPTVLQPVQATAPYATRYTAQQLTYLDQALANITAVDTPRAVAQIPMLISAADWVTMLRTQIQLLQSAARIGNLVAAGNSYLDANYATVSGLPEPLTRSAALSIAQAVQNAGAGGTIDALRTYLQQFWPVVSGRNHPLGIIYDFLNANIPTAADGQAVVSGDFLEYDAPSFPLILKQLDGLTQETDASFSYRDATNWTTEASAAYSGGSAIVASATGSEINIIFAGTGISLVHSQWSGGGVASWSIDAGAGGSGNLDMYSTTRHDQVTTTLATSLAPTLHVLRIRDLGIGTGNSILIDAVQTDGNLRLRREDDRNLFSFSGTWTTTEEGTPSGSSWHYSVDSAATATLQFTGPAIAISVTTRNDYGVLNWSIDGGTGGSGQISLASSANTFRKQFILSRTLSSGPHTLMITKASGGLIDIDAIDTIVLPAGAGTGLLDDPDVLVRTTSVSRDAALALLGGDLPVGFRSAAKRASAVGSVASSAGRAKETGLLTLQLLSAPITERATTPGDLMEGSIRVREELTDLAVQLVADDDWSATARDPWELVGAYAR